MSPIGDSKVTHFRRKVLLLIDKVKIFQHFLSGVSSSSLYKLFHRLTFFNCRSDDENRACIS